MRLIASEEMRDMSLTRQRPKNCQERINLHGMRSNKKRNIPFREKTPIEKG